MRICFSIICIEASCVHIPYFNVMKILECIYFTSMYWIFLSTCTLLHSIETSWVHVHRFTVLKLLQCMYFTTLLKLLEYMLIISLFLILLSTGSLLHLIESFLVHVPHCIQNILHSTEPSWFHDSHFARLKVFENRYCTSQNQICLTACISHHCTKAYWVHVRDFT